MRVLIDPGHGGSASGAVYPSMDAYLRRGDHAFREADLNLAIALEVEHYLQWDYGTGERRESVQAYMTRRTDRTVSLPVRARKANRFAVDCFVSIHCNAGHPSACGWEVFHFPGSERGLELAAQIEWGCVRDDLVSMLPLHGGSSGSTLLRNRGVKEANFLVLRETTMPAVLVEAGFGTNSKDLALLTDPSWQQKMGSAVAKGVLAWGEG